MRGLPVVRTNIAHGNLCVPLLSEATHQSKSGLPPCVWLAVGRCGGNAALEVICDVKKQLYFCDVAVHWFKFGLRGWAAGYKHSWMLETQVSLSCRYWQMFIAPIAPDLIHTQVEDILGWRCTDSEVLSEAPVIMLRGEAIWQERFVPIYHKWCSVQNLSLSMLTRMGWLLWSNC